MSKIAKKYSPTKAKPGATMYEPDFPIRIRAKFAELAKRSDVLSSRELKDNAEGAPATKVKTRKRKPRTVNLLKQNKQKRNPKHDTNKKCAVSRPKITIEQQTENIELMDKSESNSIIVIDSDTESEGHHTVDKGDQEFDYEYHDDEEFTETKDIIDIEDTQVGVDDVNPIDPIEVEVNDVKPMIVEVNPIDHILNNDDSNNPTDPKLDDVNIQDGINVSMKIEKISTISNVESIIGNDIHHLNVEDNPIYPTPIQDITEVEDNIDENLNTIIEISDDIITPNEDDKDVEVNPTHHLTPKECDLFGEFIARHLQQLPLEEAFKVQSGILALVTKARLEYIRQHPNEAPLLVQQEAIEENERSSKIPTQVQSRAEKRPRNTEPPDAKRLKTNNSQNESQNISITDDNSTLRYINNNPTVLIENSSNTPKNQIDSNPLQNRNLSTPESPNFLIYHNPSATTNFSSTRDPLSNRRSECIVFAEHIVAQLEQLPQDMSLKLQSEIYLMLENTRHSKPVPDETARSGFRIKEEIIEDC